MNEKITTERIIELMMEKTGRDRATVQTFVGELTALVSDSLIQDGLTRIKGIGKFRIVPVKERESVNPAGERIVIPAHHWLSFLPDKFLKDRINKPFASFEAIEAGEGDAPIEQPEDAEREYVDDDDTPTDEVPLSAPTPDNVQKDKPEAPEENVLPIVTAHEVADVDDVDDTEEKVEPVTLIGSEWNNENQHTMNREIKKEIAEGWSEGRSVGSNSDAASERSAAHLQASEIITPEVAEKANEPVVDSSRKDEQNTTRKKAAAVIPPVAPPPPREPQQQPPKRNEKQPTSNVPLYVILALLLLLLLGGLFYHYFYYLPSSDREASTRTVGSKVVTGDTFVLPGEDAAEKKEAADRKAKSKKEAKEEEKVDPATAADRARRAAEEAEAKEKAKAEAESKTKEEPKAKPTTTPKRKVLATVRLEPGQFLTKLAEKYYGNKVFWVYIYEFNKSRIADPNHIPTNMEIKIPAKEVYGINANSSASVEKAKKIQARLNAQK